MQPFDEGFSCIRSAIAIGVAAQQQDVARMGSADQQVSCRCEP